MNAVPSPADIAAFWASAARNHEFPNEQDRFGLPMVGPSLLSPAGHRQEVTDKCQGLAQDAVAAVERLLGVHEARKIFRNALRTPKTGKAPNASRNRELLAKYDAEVAKNPAKKRGAVSVVAKREGPKELLAREHFARQIRRLVAARKEAEEAQQKLDAFLKSFPPSLLVEAADIKSD
jgi:hypothetical protein